jgi:tight adherence protein C
MLLTNLSNLVGEELASHVGLMRLAMAASGVALAVLIHGLVLSYTGRRAARRRLRVDLGGPASLAEAPDDLTALTAPVRRNGAALDAVLAKANVLVARLDAGKLKLARQRMIRAGFFSDNAVAAFFLARLGAAIALPAGLCGLIATSAFEPTRPTLLLFAVMAGAMGYLGPSLYLDKRAKRVMRENRAAFPDFMDLMGVCANAGLSMEAGLERVTQELAPMYPSLGVNLQILCLEVRAGRPIDVALQMLAQRLDVPEVRAFATLLQQSRELGSSLSDALRVFSEDMRHQRLAIAEEKAYALPAKLSVPVTACILPVVLFIAIWPVVVQFNG